MRRNLFVALILIALAIVMVYLIPQGMSIYNGMTGFQHHSLWWGVFYGIAAGVFLLILWSVPKDARATPLKVLLWIIWIFFIILSKSAFVVVGMMKRNLLDQSNLAFLVPLIGIAALICGLGIYLRGYLERKKHSSGALA